MKPTYISILLFSFLHLVGIGVWAQEVKTESEKRINPSEAPQLSNDFISATFDDIKRLKWYKEVTSGKKSYEAKFKFSRRKYSVEFDDEGNIEDVEIAFKLKELPPSVGEAMEEAFSKIEKFKLQKIQEQWSAKDEISLREAIVTQNRSLATIQYEVVFRGVIDGENAIWEGTFSEKGALLKRQKVILRPTDNLDF